MSSLRRRASQIYRDGGPLELLGRSLRFAGNRIVSKSDERRKREMIDNYRDDPKYLNVGGGDFVREHWRVLDYYTPWYDYSDVFIDFDIDLEDLDRWPIEDDSYDLVYSSHALEHLSDDAVERTLEEAHRILKPGGRIRINVPDMDLVLRHYDEGNIEWFTDVWRQKYTHGGYDAEGKCPPGYELEFYLLVFFASYLVIERHESVDYEQIRRDRESMDTAAFLDEYSERIRDEWQDDAPNLHRNWFTFDRLSELLADARFTEIERSQCRQSRSPELCADDFDHHQWMSLYVEAVKPTR